jgi:2-desacetyl-2-hydroxyethyl bacteriochlorophyllide A dehydrogenase
MGYISAPGRATLIERELPPLGPGQVLISVKYAALCGSDLHIYKGKHPAVALPTAIGHELAGVVSAVGEEVGRFRPGDRVTVEPVLACGRCRPCLQGQYGYCRRISYQYRQGQGAFTTHYIAEERYVYRLPSSLSLAAGALIEPLAVAVHAVKRAAVALDEQVVVLGAGAIGILVAAVCRSVGAGRVVISDYNPRRLALAGEMGLEDRVDLSAGQKVEEIVDRISDGCGADKVFECVGLEQTFNQMTRLLRIGGTGIQLGIYEQPRISIDAALFVSREITIRGSQGYCWDFETALSLSRSISLERLITHSFRLEQLDEAFGAALNPEADACKVLIETGPPSGEGRPEKDQAL